MFWLTTLGFRFRNVSLILEYASIGVIGTSTLSMGMPALYTQFDATCYIRLWKYTSLLCISDGNHPLFCDVGLD